MFPLVQKTITSLICAICLCLSSLSTEFGVSQHQFMYTSHTYTWSLRLATTIYCLWSSRTNTLQNLPDIIIYYVSTCANNKPTFVCPRMATINKFHSIERALIAYIRIYGHDVYWNTTLLTGNVIQISITRNNINEHEVKPHCIVHYKI